jgi:hypothetical protein
MLNILCLLAGFLIGWCLIGSVIVFVIPEGQWAGVPRWRAALTWPLAFVQE